MQPIPIVVFVWIKPNDQHREDRANPILVWKWDFSKRFTLALPE
jgi:hypothetical protein